MEGAALDFFMESGYHNKKQKRRNDMAQGRRIWILALVLCLILGGCGGSTKEYEAEIQRLREENNALNIQVEQLRAQLDQLMFTRLDSWTLDARGTGEDVPADITFTARPAAYEEGQQAQLLVILNGDEAARISCGWDGEQFLCSLSLQPQDGYSYYCILTTQEGTEEQVELTTPDHPVQPRLVYLKSSLTASIDALVSSQRQDKGVITADLTASIQLPLLTEDGVPVSVNECSILWMLDEDVLSSMSLELAEGETEGSLTGFAQGLLLEHPDLEKGNTLRLMVSAKLSNGRVLNAEAASWTGTEEGLQDAVG